jgi:hypothetical protein
VRYHAPYETARHIDRCEGKEVSEGNHGFPSEAFTARREPKAPSEAFTGPDLAVPGQNTRLNQSSDRSAEIAASSAANAEKNAVTSVSFFSITKRELSPW